MHVHHAKPYKYRWTSRPSNRMAYCSGANTINWNSWASAWRTATWSWRAIYWAASMIPCRRQRAASLPMAPGMLRACFWIAHGSSCSWMGPWYSQSDCPSSIEGWQQHQRHRCSDGGARSQRLAMRIFSFWVSTGHTLHANWKRLSYVLTYFTSCPIATSACFSAIKIK